MPGVQIIRAYSARAGSIGAGSPWPVRLFVWLILAPLAILAILVALFLAAGFLLLALARSLVLSAAAWIRRIAGPGDGRRNVRVIDPRER